jgi:ATP-dependent DNA helicase RecG
MGPLTRDELAALIAAGEDSFTEFKESVSPSDLAKELCAFANAHGGRVLIGVDDDGGIVGDVEWTDERAMNVARTSIDPAIVPTFQRLAWEPETEIAVVGVDQGVTKPYSVRSGERRAYYIRVGSTSREATREELIRLTQASGAVAPDLRPVLSATLDDLDPALPEQRFAGLRSIRWEQLSGEERRRVLVNADILDAEGRHPTIAGLLAYGTEPQRHLPYATVTCVAYPGVEVERRLLDRVEIGGRLDEQLEQTAAFIERNLARSSVVSGLERVERLRPSHESFREVIANAVAHRHYGITGPVQVRVFSDRVEVTSPGGLPNGATVEGMRVGLSVRRNEWIFQHLASLRLVDAVGRGVVLLFEEALERGLPEPRIEPGENWTTVTLFLGEVARASDARAPAAVTTPTQGVSAGGGSRRVWYGRPVAIASASSSATRPAGTSGCCARRVGRSRSEPSMPAAASRPHRLAGENVLLVDDTWTTGAHVESAALVLRGSGAGSVGAVVIGRHIREEYGDNAERLKALPRFSWERCAFE